MKTPLTAEYKKRVKQSIVETQNLIAKEMKYSEDLRRHDFVKQMEEHLIHLNDMLKNGWNAPVFA